MGAGRLQLAIATATVLLVTGVGGWLGLGWIAPALLGLTTLLVLAVAGWTQAKLGGLTGDVYGAICELGETAALLAVVAVAQRGMWP